LDAVLDALWLTVTRRWFVLAFLVSFLALSIRHLGGLRTLALLVFGYGIAWASEASSIRNGFPYGLYEYLWRPGEPTGLDPREPALLGVPCFDSISYVFIAYASMCMAHWVLGVRGARRAGVAVWLAASSLFVTIDLVTDPVALRGGEWFLGRIYHYPGGGAHHGVPLSNYGGWLLVGLAIIGVFGRIDRLLPESRARGGPGLGAALYLSIMAFCIAVAGHLRAWDLVLSGACIAFPLAVLAAARCLLGRGLTTPDAQVYTGPDPGEEAPSASP
jgi:putative membrane protein